VSSVLERRDSVSLSNRLAGSRLLVIGVLTFTAVLVGWLVYACTHPAPATIDPVDLQVYRNGGLIVRHVSPPYDKAFQYPLYDWPKSKVALKFTYTPFAAIFFSVISFVSWAILPRLSQVVNLLLLIAAAWSATGLLSGTGPAVPGSDAASRQRSTLGTATRVGATLLGAAAGLVTEPVFRTLYLGQVNLLLLALILADLSLSGSRWRWFKGAGIGVAAGIKLVPLVFILYLLLTRQLRAAATATGVFAVTVLLGFVVVPGDANAWWLHGLFLQDGRTGFVGWGGNQSLRGLLTRLAGSINGAGTAWVLLAVLVAIVGLASAVLLHRAGHVMLAILATALVGLLDSPISWDHHWVWVVPGIMTAACYAARARKAGRLKAARWCAVLTAAMLLIYFPWPGSFWSVPVTGPGDFTAGLVWAGPNSKVSTYVLFGDNPAYKEYHWAGLQNLSGNAFILAGLALLVLLAVTAARARGPMRGPGQVKKQPGEAVLPA
jgi:alpha-1,2-mannosyltransferase